MNKNSTTACRTLSLTLASLGALDGLQPVAADILLYDEDETILSSDGYFNAFYVNSDIDHQGKTYDRYQSRVKMGFLPNYIGFSFGKEIDGLSLGGHAFFWVTTNDSETGGTGTTIDVRQFYDAVVGDWGEVLIGKGFGLFSRSDIFLDELLTGFGNPSDTLGLVDDKGVSFDNIGTGYPYPFPTSQITYHSNDLLPGLHIAVGILDPINSNQIDKEANGGLDDKAYQDSLCCESEISYRFNLIGTQVYGWINGGYQTSRNTSDSVDSMTSKGVGYDLQVKMGGFSMTDSGFTTKGINPFLTNNAGEAALHEVDSRGALPQSSCSQGKNRLTLSYGKTAGDGNSPGSAADYESRGIAYFRMINDNLKLVVGLNRCRIDRRDGAVLDEDTNTVALGAVPNW